MMRKRRLQFVRRGDRGATLPEYAMIVALVVIVSLGAITRLRDGSTEELEERESVSSGANDVSGAGFTYSVTPGGSTGDDTDPPPTLVTPDSVTTPDSQTGSKNTDATWNGSVTIIVSAGTEKVQNALAQVTFDVAGTLTTVSCPLPSTKKGEIACEISGIPEGVTSITMVVDRIYGSNIVEYVPDPKPMTVFDCPKSVCK
ncbi:MAG: Flp family type IVb pilin [Mycobacterium sp.]